MPPKPKFKKEDIIEAAFSVVREHGWNTLSQRSVAEKLNSSIGPIYTHFKSMEELEEEVIRKTYELLFSYMTKPRTGETVDYSLGYVLFAKEERKLFKCFIDEKYTSMRKKYDERLFMASGEKSYDLPLFKGMSVEQIDEYRRRMIIFLYGKAVYLNVYHSLEPYIESEEELTDYLKETSQMLLKGFKDKYKISD